MSMRLSATSKTVSASTAMPTGTLTKKIHSQPRYLVRMPPMRTPTAAPLPPTAPQIPSALFRSAPSAKSVVTIERAAGETIAAGRTRAINRVGTGDVSRPVAMPSRHRFRRQRPGAGPVLTRVVRCLEHEIGAEPEEEPEQQHPRHEDWKLELAVDVHELLHDVED